MRARGRGRGTRLQLVLQRYAEWGPPGVQRRGPTRESGTAEERVNCRGQQRPKDSWHWAGYLTPGLCRGCPWGLGYDCGGGNLMRAGRQDHAEGSGGTETSGSWEGYCGGNGSGILTGALSEPLAQCCFKNEDGRLRGLLSLRKGYQTLQPAGHETTAEGLEGERKKSGRCNIK